MNDMKRVSLRFAVLMAAMIMTMMSFAKTQDWGGRVIDEEGDTMRTTVAGTILEKAGTISDALSKIPSLEAERDGGVKVLGRGDAEVYINGRRVQDWS